MEAYSLMVVKGAVGANHPNLPHAEQQLRAEELVRGTAILIVAVAVTLAGDSVLQFQTA